MNRPQTGNRINNYLLDERIGAGSFGEVWKAHHHIFNEPVAVKIPTDPQYVRHLRREGLSIHGLQSENIVRVLDLDPFADPPYLIMEYVDGPSLRQLIEQNPNGIPIEPALVILYGILLGLKVAHEANLIHRDIKPANILISGGSDLVDMITKRVKITDFGLGRAGELTSESIMQSGSISDEASRRLAGTLAYMSPEQRDGESLDTRSDLYSTGVVLHEMLTGLLPQGSDPPSAIRNDIPSWLDRFFERCYTHRNNRFRSAADMQAEIDRNWRLPDRQDTPGDDKDLWIESAGHQRQCPTCNGTINAEDQFCIHCGQQLVRHVPRCPSCHAFVGQADNFCILCGTDLRKKA